jgi:hypothetical protein
VSPPDSPDAPSSLKANWWKLALGVALTAYFLVFNWGSLRVHLTGDDLSNTAHYQQYSRWQLVVSNFLPWRGDSRPFGAFFYLPVYHFGGLNPVPWHAVLLAILLVNVYLAYRLVVLLSGNEPAAALVALACCYHAGVANLYYNSAFVFDALCSVFFLASLAYYVRIRQRGRLLGRVESLVFLLLVLFALNSKEMAVALPVMELAYEWFYHPPAQWKPSVLFAWLWGPARLSLIAGAITLLDIYGKIAGRDAMTQSEAYHPVFSMAGVHVFQINLLQDLLCSWQWTPGWPQIVGVYAVLAFLAWRRADRPVLRFCFWFLIVVALPIEFVPPRRQACFVLLMFAAATFAAVVFVDGVTSAARFLSREFKLPAVGYPVLIGVVVGMVVLLWVREQRHWREYIGGDPMTTLGSELTDIIEQMRASNFHPRPGSSVDFLDDPYHSFIMYFMAELWVHDHSVAIHTWRQGELTPEQVAKMDYVFTIENRKLIRVR